MLTHLRKVAVGIIGISLIATLGACGGSAASGKTEVKFFNGKTESVKMMDTLISEFNKQSEDYKVVQEFQKDASTALQQKFASGDVPDVVSADITQDYIDNGLFQDLSKDDFWNGVDPSIKEIVTDAKSGKQYKVALTKSIGGVFYNKDLISNVKTDSWDDFTTSLKAAGGSATPLFLGGKDSWTLGQLMDFWGHGLVKQEYSLVKAKQLFVDNKQKTLKFRSDNGPIAVFADRLQEMKSAGLINSNAATASYDDQIAAFAEGKAVAIPQGIWAVSAIKEKNPKINIGFAAFAPMEEGKKPVVLSAEDSTLGIPSKAKNADGAKAFITFLLKKGNLKRYSEALNLPSAYSDVDSNWIDNPEEFKTVIDDAVSIGFTSYPSGFSSDDSGRYVQALLSGQYSNTDDFVKAYSDAWNKAWDNAN